MSMQLAIKNTIIVGIVALIVVPLCIPGVIYMFASRRR